MEATWKVIQAYLGFGTAQQCRRCGGPIPTRDQFGRSEGVCRGCR
jgi:hypothetical protein